MTDLLVLLLFGMFFGIAVVFVRACEHLIGPDTESMRGDATADDATAA